MEIDIRNKKVISWERERELEVTGKSQRTFRDNVNILLG